MKYNVNHFVWVCLTPKGWDIWHDYWKDTDYMDLVFTDKTPHKRIDIDDKTYVRFQMHELMHIFGQHVGPACGDVPFETNMYLFVDPPDAV